MRKKVLLLVLMAGCIDNKHEKAAQDTPSEPQALAQTPDASPVPADALALAVPETGTHLDEVNTDYQPILSNPFDRIVAPRQESKRNPIELVLRSSPPGARASVDGKFVGVTPTYWSGKADGKAHEFTFVKEQFRVARYRFVSTQSGVVHGTLAPLVKEPDAGVATQ